ncbi:leucine-rich repeat domain-containing protein, partial [Butyribacter intestini]
APYCFSEKLHLPEKLQNEYDEIDIDKTIYHEFAGEFANSIKLPDGVMQIGNNAFYNCKKLESITIGKNIKEVGSDVFMNCRSLNKIYLRSDISDITGLKQVLSRISSEIEVIYIKEEKVIAKVLYPEYSEVYDEIAPAHIFGRNIEGEGFRARQCFDGGKADMNQYDTIFPKASAEESVKVAGKIALYRLIYPYMLGSSSEVLYMDYLKNNKNEIIGSCIYDKNIDEIKFMLEKFSGDRSMIERAIVVANETGFGEAAALILKYRRKKEDIRKSRYAF